MGKQESRERQEVKQICVILTVGRQIMNTPWFWSGDVETVDFCWSVKADSMDDRPGW